MILVLALLCGVATGVFVFFIADAPTPSAQPAPIAPVHVANPAPPPTTVMAQAQPAVEEGEAAQPPRIRAATTKMKPETQPDEQPDESPSADGEPPRSGASLAQRVRHARRQCHEMAERVCRCFPQTCTQQRDAQHSADRSVVDAARNLERMPDALRQMLDQLEQSCRDTYAAVRRSMPQCF